MEKYRLSNEAVADLTSIWDYTKKVWSENQAELYTNRIFDKLESLTRKESRKIQTRFGEYYLSRCDKHYIIFQYREFQPIFILRIIHQQMDLDKHLKNIL